MINELRMLLAEKLLGWVVIVVPKNDEGVKLIVHLAIYFQNNLDEILANKQSARKKSFGISKAESLGTKEEK